MTASVSDALQLGLQTEDTASSYRALDQALHPLDIEWGSEEHKLGIMSAFKSPLYSDGCKEASANSALRYEFLFLIEGEFLTEKIIFSFVDGPAPKVFRLDHFAALMGSEQLSERIISAAVRKMDIFNKRKALELLSNSMITPEVLSNWVVKASGGPRGSFISARSVSALRIKQVHPEYAGLPDEWVLKVFGGW